MTAGEVMDFIVISRNQRKAALIKETIWLHPHYSNLIDKINIPNVSVAACMVIPNTPIQLHMQTAVLQLHGHWSGHVEEWHAETRKTRRIRVPM